MYDVYFTVWILVFRIDKQFWSNLNIKLHNKNITIIIIIIIIFIIFIGIIFMINNIIINNNDDNTEMIWLWYWC